MSRLLLISNSTLHGGGYLDHCAEEIDDFLEGVESVLFVPWALHDLDGYATRARERFARLGRSLTSIHEAEDPTSVVAESQSIFVGGGNTFRLLKRLRESGVMPTIRKRVEEGMPYVGTSAGSNVACATIRTTNDMPIVEPGTFEALGLVPFNINPHYLDPDPSSTHQGETREERIREFLEENDRVVVGLREGAMLRIETPEVVLRGSTSARIFQRSSEPREVTPGTRLDELLELRGPFRPFAPGVTQ